MIKIDMDMPECCGECRFCGLFNIKINKKEVIRTVYCWAAKRTLLLKDGEDEIKRHADCRLIPCEEKEEK